MLLQFLMQGKGGGNTAMFKKYQQKAEHFMCSCIGKGTNNVQKTPGGLIFKQRFNKKVTDPNLLVGAIIGGPDAYDNFVDQRDSYEQSEPATYNNASLLRTTSCESLFSVPIQGYL